MRLFAWDVNYIIANEIRDKLRDAGYADQFEFHKHQDQPYLIDMHGIAVTTEGE